MITRIREVRKAKGLTLQQVADRCRPPTTPQTVGRLETGIRTVSMGWLRRIAEGLGVDPTDLVTLPDRPDVPVAAVLGHDGASAPNAPISLTPPHPGRGNIAVQVTSAHGEYRAGDILWLEQLRPERFAVALNHDVLAPRPAGRYQFGRFIGRQDGRIQLQPLIPGARQSVLADPPWLAIVRTLIRNY